LLTLILDVVCRVFALVRLGTFTRQDPRQAKTKYKTARQDKTRPKTRQDQIRQNKTHFVLGKGGVRKDGEVKEKDNTNFFF
jgi:hypothetical protein